MGKERQNRAITYEEARKKIEDMTLINNFLFNSVMEDEERAKAVSKIVISTVVGHEVNIKTTIGEKILTGIDIGMHGVRFDALIGAEDGDSSEVAYDFEVEDREADRPGLPRRQRFYSAMVDSKLLKSNCPYENLPDYVSITVLSYDPFGAGDMYYEAKSVLTSHSDLCYDDGRVNYFFYGKGKNNLPDSKFDKQAVEDLVKYIVTGEKPEKPQEAVGKLDDIINSVKKNAEVTKIFMKEWDRRRLHDIELTEEVTKQVTKEVMDNATIDFIVSMREEGISDDRIRYQISKKGNYLEEDIDRLFHEADTSATKS
ncbi:hypothetical protein [Butyrivibrio sp. AE3004]|uniref:hypothetical protein n=1 Tax=Butyrivibrio sp. AE3004 TaxID=1506994 RepID=UPI00049405FE|nr:hypothetical protein [Butyrivibrio sp. AE3004]